MVCFIRYKYAKESLARLVATAFLDSVAQIASIIALSKRSYEAKQCESRERSVCEIESGKAI